MQKQEPEPESSTLRQQLAALQRWFWVIALAAVLAGAGAWLMSRWSRPVYEASTTLLVQGTQANSSSDYEALRLSEQLAKTYSQMLKGKAVLAEVQKRLTLTMGIGELSRMVSIDAATDSQLITLRVRHTDPAIAAQIANAIPQVLSEQNRARQAASLASTQSAVSQEMQRLESEIKSTQDALSAEQAKPKPSAGEVARLDAQLTQGRATYAGLRQSYEDIRVAQAKGSEVLSVLEPAEVPARPVLPRPLSNILLAELVGALLAGSVAFAWEHMDDTVRRPADVERAAHLPTLACIARFSGPALKEGPLLLVRPRSATAEGYRVLRNDLLTSLGGRGRSTLLILVTSARPLEGKTTVVANLAVSLAQTGKQVLVVDTDFRRPTLESQFSVHSGPGLSELLRRGKANLGEAIQETRAKGVSLLPAGTTALDPIEVLGRPEMATILERLKDAADYVLLDSPPVLSVADAGILARHVNGVLLVVEAGKTSAQVLHRAVALLERANATLLGVVLNKMGGGPGAYLHDGYYYSYYLQRRGRV